MQLPVAPLALLIALVPTLLLVAMAAWRASNGSLTAFHTAALALGLALASLVGAVSATYAMPQLLPIRASNALMAVPCLVYTAALVVVGIKCRINCGSLVVWALVGVVPLWFLGFYAWLLAACSFGDCL
jgi:hypothetical protein